MYREEVSWPVWFHLIFAAVVALCAGAAIAALRRSGLGLHSAVLLASALLAAGAWWRMRHVALEVGPDEVAFGFGGLRRRVPRARIEALERETYPVARYMGWGYRFGWKPRDRAYSIIGRREGLRLRFRDERDRTWHIFLACSDPQAALNAFDRKES